MQFARTRRLAPHWRVRCAHVLPKDNMNPLSALFDNNRQWAVRMSQQAPSFFSKLARQQNPQFLWIGCSDSRVPANEVVGLMPGELFVHRNVANLVNHTDMNCLSVLQYAIESLKIEHVIVCGHYGCGGIKSIFENKPHGLIDNWLRSIYEIYRKNRATLLQLPTDDARINKLCELNVIDQVKNVGNTTIVREAWQRGQRVSIYGWIYSIADGLLKDLDVCVSCKEDLLKVEAL